MWGYLYGAKFGPFTQLADKLGTARRTSSRRTTCCSIANVVTWEFAGYNMIILYAALRAIPTELYEAAELDGAGPSGGPAHQAAALATGARRDPALLGHRRVPALQRAEGPPAAAGSVSTPDWTPNLYAYNLAFTDQRLNYAAAVSFLLGFIILLATYLAFGLGRLRRRT